MTVTPPTHSRPPESLPLSSTEPTRALTERLAPSPPSPAPASTSSFDTKSGLTSSPPPSTSPAEGNPPELGPKATISLSFASATILGFIVLWLGIPMFSDWRLHTALADVWWARQVTFPIGDCKGEMNCSEFSCGLYSKIFFGEGLSFAIFD